MDIFLRTKSVGAVITLHFLWDFADFMNHMMIVERYRYGGSFNALALQIPVLIVMLVIAVFVYIIRVHGNANNAFNRWGAKRVKDHKRYLYNLAKKKGVQRDEKMYFSMAGAGNRRRAV